MKTERIAKVNQNDAEWMEKVKRVIARGNNAEVKKQPDGSFGVYEVKKSIQ